MNAPLYNSLMAYSAEKRISFAMPGHKGKIPKWLIELDVTELSHTADLHHESKSVTRANRLLAEYYGTRESFILTAGSTTAIQAMIASVLSPGQTLLVNNDCHMSVINICAMLGINIRIINKGLDGEFLIPFGLDDIEACLEEHSDIDAVLITSPNYYGICEDIGEIAAECHWRGIPLLCDEAHGAHFKAIGMDCLSAVGYADLVCHSAHKTLNALTGAAYLHVCGDFVSPKRVRECINIFESSSPSYVIAASADFARANISEESWCRLCTLCAEFKWRVSEAGLSVLENDDPTRLVIGFNGFNITGFEAERRLADEFGIDVEMADMTNIVLIATPGNGAEDFEKTAAALGKIAAGIKPIKKYRESTFFPRCDDDICSASFYIERGIIKSQRAFFSRGAAVNLSDAVGKISKSTVCAYPPGTPIIFAGEKIRDEHIKFLNNLIAAGAKITGLDNNKINVISE